MPKQEESQWSNYITDSKYNMARIKVTQVKSIIDRPKKQKDTMFALGLRKMNQTVEVEGTPQVLGMIKKVNHLVKTENV